MSKSDINSTLKTAITVDLIRQEYKEKAILYERLGKNIVDAMQTFLDEVGIPYLDITTRIKDIESAIEKIQRKSYVTGFENIEDWCGIRIICYYPGDIDKICNILRKEFTITTEENTATRLSPHEFGYRSTHFILTIKKQWLEAPNYRKLKTLKAEIQVRTVLMHAWAEIEHKLAYKSAEQVPNEFQRRLYRLSAKFEEADEQFEDLRLGLTKYRESLETEAKEDIGILKEKELNLDTLQIFLDKSYPDRKRDLGRSAGLLKELSSFNFTMTDLIDAVNTQRPILKQTEAAGSSVSWAQVGAMRNALELSNDDYYKKRSARREGLESASGWGHKVLHGRMLLGKI